MQPRLVELHDVRACRKQIFDLRVDGIGERECERIVARVMLIHRLLRHRERTRQRDLDRLVGIGAQERDIVDLDRYLTLDRPGYDRHRDFPAGAAGDLANARPIDAVERVCKLVRVALASDLAVGDDVDPGAFLLADRNQRRIVLRLLQKLARHTPDVAHAYARRHVLLQCGAIDQPIRLREAADDGGPYAFAHAGLRAGLGAISPASSLRK